MANCGAHVDHSCDLLKYTQSHMKSYRELVARLHIRREPALFSNLVDLAILANFVFAVCHRNLRT